MPNDLEPLTELAVYSFQNAPQLCVEEHACCDYHRIWSLARLANPIGPNLAGWQFLHRQLAILTDTQPSPRVLISGAADTGLLSLVLAGLKDSHANAQIILVDRCATPVRQNEQLCEKLVSMFRGFLVVDALLNLNTGMKGMFGFAQLRYRICQFQQFLRGVAPGNHDVLVRGSILQCA